MVWSKSSLKNFSAASVKGPWKLLAVMLAWEGFSFLESSVPMLSSSKSTTAFEREILDDESESDTRTERCFFALLSTDEHCLIDAKVLADDIEVLISFSSATIISTLSEEMGINEV